jgi:flagellar motor switch protein FliN
MNMEAFVQELVEQMRVVFATTLDAAVDMTPTTVSGAVWSVPVRLPDGAGITIAFDDIGAGALARAMAPTAEPTDDAIRQALREFCSNAIAAAGTKIWGRDDITADIGGAELIEWPAAAGGGASRFASPALAAPITAMVIADTPGIPHAAAAPRAAAPPPPSDAARLDVLLGIDLPLVVRFGGTQLPLKVLSRLGPGSVIDLSRAPDDPVEMLVGDRVVARGEVVMVSGCYGIRVLEVVGGRDGDRGVETR